MGPFERVFRHAWPEAEIVWAVDSGDPVDAPGRTVSMDWNGPRRARGTVEALMRAACGNPAAEWLLKLDVDTAHVSQAWLTGARPDSMLVGCQNGRAMFDMLGLAFAIRRRALVEIHAGEDCDVPGPESGAIHRAVRKRHLNEVWLWPHRPKSGGMFATMTRPEKAGLYRGLFSLVHCGVGPRSRAAEMLAEFERLTPSGIL